MISGIDYRPQWDYGEDDDYPEGPPDTTSELSDEDDRDDGEVPYQFKSIIYAIGRFQNLKRVEVQHDAEVCGPSNEDYQSGNHREWTEYREQFFEQLINGLNDEAHPALNLSGLCIENLQDLVNKEIAGSKNFTAVLKMLDTLELGIATESYSASPENEITIAERHTFFGRDLVKYWLQPVQDHLVHLKLYCDTYWGYAPIFNYESLQFPKLKSLALGNFTFFSDRQLDWILSHGDTLESLSLDDCPILHAARVQKPVNADGSMIYNIDEGLHWDYEGADNFWSYDARWHDYFQRIKNGLQKLKHFGIGHGNWQDDYDRDGGSAFVHAPLKKAELDYRRYCIFNCGIGPSQWVECRIRGFYDSETGSYEEKDVRYDGAWEEDEGPTPKVPGSWREDKTALDELLHKISTGISAFPALASVTLGDM